MIALIISLFLVSLFLVFSGAVAIKRFNGRSDLWEFCGVLLLAIGVISFMVSIFMSIDGFVAKKDARFVNKHYGTSYTTEEFFWNGEEIKTMVIGNRSRVKLEN